MATVGLGELSGILLLLQTGLLVQIGNGVIFRHLSPATLFPFFLYLVVVILLRGAAAWGSRYAGHFCAASVKEGIRKEIVENLSRRGPIALAGMRAGEAATIAVDAVESIGGYFSKYLPQRAIATLLPFTFLAVVFPLDWISGIILIATALFLPITMIVIGEEAHERNRKLWERLARMSGRFLDLLQGLGTIKSFGAGRREAAALARTSEEYRLATMSVMRIAFLSAFMLELISTVSIAIVAVVSGLRMLAGSMSFAPGYFVLLAAPEYFLVLRSLGTHYHTRMEAVSAAEQLLALFEKEPAAGTGAGDLSAFAVEGGPDGVRRASARRSLGGIAPLSLELSEVAASYGGEAVFEGVNLRIAAGEHLALVGPSGAGKSTLLALILGFLVPRSGSLRAEGVDLRDLDWTAWHEMLAWLPQRPLFLRGTIDDNIRLGREGASRTEIEDAALQSRASEFIERLPDGYETVIGERGQGLSGGELQRVALARLFLRAPRLILLDEPTAHLDRESERLVNEGIAELARGRTLLLVTHREAGLNDADRVVTLASGRVEETKR